MRQDRPNAPVIVSAGELPLPECQISWFLWIARLEAPQRRRLTQPVQGVVAAEVFTPMTVPDLNRVEVTSSVQLWNWLASHHSQPHSILLVTWKAAHRERYVSRHEVLDAIIAYGWVDGRRYKLDDDRTMQLLSPRKRQEWAASYKERAERLEAEGKMQPAGRAAIDASKSVGLWNASDAVDRLDEPDDLVVALTSSTAYAWWASAAPSYRRNILRWIASAKKPETRQKRISIATAHAKRGEKVPNY